MPGDNGEYRRSGDVSRQGSRGNGEAWEAEEKKGETLPMRGASSSGGGEATQRAEEEEADLEFLPLTVERWGDFEELFGEHGAYSGCWCMWWRVTRARFQKQLGEGNRLAMKAIVASGEIPGILAYHRGRAVGWCSVAPRENFAALERSRKLRRVDDRPVWSVVCFYVAPDYRRRGLMRPLLEAAVAHARENGAEIVEGYPVDVPDRLTGSSGYVGLKPVFRAVGFKEVARPSESQSIMRYEISPPPG
jgi:GNAT superfamily N-acetyltransferase